jgi:prepilin-type N-terminal cleavage/methylation domain-containing protein/prepilin-type processing-associated H-X9-DG protein
MTRRRAFTLIELLVVVAIIGTLIAILIPSLARARTLAKRTVCATNLKGQGNAFAVYAAQFGDALPNDPGGNWLHDVNSATCDALVGFSLSGNLSAASVRKWFYCPTNFDANTDNAWFAIRMGDPIPANPAVPAYRWLDYAYFNSRGCATVLPLARLTNRSPKLSYKTKLIGTPNSADAELVCDEILTSSPSGADFAIPNKNSYFHEYSSHLKKDKPEGMNVLTCDGHVGWRTWPRANQITPIPQAGGQDSFWVIDP